MDFNILGCINTPGGINTSNISNVIEVGNKLIGKDNGLNTTPTMELLGGLEKYKNLDLKRISESELSKILRDAIPFCPLYSIYAEQKTKLYRIRYREKGQVFKKTEDVWYPKPFYIEKRGRLNDVGKSILYTSLDQGIPFFELKAEKGQSYAVIEYEVKKGCELKLMPIGVYVEFPEDVLSIQGELNRKIIDQFLYTEFTKDVGKGTEYLYRISNKIVENFYDMPGYDGYIYPSVAFKTGPNIGIKPFSADRKINIKSVSNIIIENLSEDGAVTGFMESRSSHMDAAGNIFYKKT